MPGDAFQGHHGSLDPSFCLPMGLGKSRSWLEHTGQRAAMARSHCLDSKELGCSPLLSSFLPLSLLGLGTVDWAQG